MEVAVSGDDVQNVIAKPMLNLASTTAYMNTSNTSAINFQLRKDKDEITAELSPLLTFMNNYGIQTKLHYLGLVGNLLCILVFTRKQMVHRKSIFYLIFLALSDFLYNFFVQLPNVLKLMKVAEKNIFTVSDFSCFFYDYVQVIFHVYSVLITLFVTIDRFNHIYNPLKFNQKFIPKKTKLIVGFGLFILSTIFALPHGYLFVYSETEQTCDAREWLKARIGNSSISFYKIYFTFTEPVIMWFIPGLIIVFMNIYVIFKIFQSKKMPVKKLPTTTSFKNTLSNSNNSHGMQGMGMGIGMPVLGESPPTGQQRKIYLYHQKNNNINNMNMNNARVYYEAMGQQQAIDLEHCGGAAGRHTRPQSSVSSSAGSQPAPQLPPGVLPVISSPQRTNTHSTLNNHPPSQVNIYMNKVKFYFSCFVWKGRESEDYETCTPMNNRNNIMIDYDMIEFGRRHTGCADADDMQRPNFRKNSFDDYILNKNNNRKFSAHCLNPLRSKATSKLNKLQRMSSIQSSMMNNVNNNTNNTNLMSQSQSNRIYTLKYRILNLKNTKLSVNQISHYITIIILGFYFIVTTIPYGILLSLQNDLTTGMNLYLESREAYLNDPLWKQHGRMRDIVCVVKFLFITNHCLNFFLYLLFNRLFRLTILQIALNLKKFFAFSFLLTK